MVSNDDQACVQSSSSTVSLSRPQGTANVLLSLNRFVSGIVTGLVWKCQDDIEN